MEQRVSIERMEEAINLFGSFDENIRLLEAEFHVTVVNRDGELRISGEPEEVMMAAKAVEALLTLSGKGESITEQHVRYVIGLCRSGQSERIGELTQDVICITSKGRPVKPKTIGQKQYVQAVLHSPVTIGESGWASCPATSRARWTPTYGLYTTPCSICWGRRRTRNIWSVATSRWPRWPICVVGRWMTALSFSTRPRTPAGSR